jgi:hypothetical protein
MNMYEKLNKYVLEKDFKSKNINDLIDKLTKHKKNEIKELEEIDLVSYPPYHKDYIEGYIEGLTKCIDILNFNKSRL